MSSAIQSPFDRITITLMGVFNREREGYQWIGSDGWTYSPLLALYEATLFPHRDGLRRLTRFEQEEVKGE